MTRNQTTIISALKNRRLFGSLPRRKSLDTRTSWIVALKTMFGLGMTAHGLVIFQRHTGRSLSPAGGSKETYLIVGRRGGKSFISALIAAFISAISDFRKYVTVAETRAARYRWLG